MTQEHVSSLDPNWMGVAWLLHDAADDDLKEHRLVVGQDCEPDCDGQGGQHHDEEAKQPDHQLSVLTCLWLSPSTSSAVKTLARDECGGPGEAEQNQSGGEEHQKQTPCAQLS